MHQRVRAASKSIPQGSIAGQIACALLEGFNKHYRLFRQVSREAKQRFEQGDWPAVRAAHAERIQYYDDRARETVERLQREFDTDSLPEGMWREIKLHYVGLLTDHKQPELAETFFNTVSCKLLHRHYYRNDFIFVRPAVSTEYLEGDPPAYRSVYPLKDGAAGRDPAAGGRPPGRGGLIRQRALVASPLAHLHRSAARFPGGSPGSAAEGG
jgi:isocitrate dehydrogenase kinase/phosphatase